jgi:hypothetical protein
MTVHRIGNGKELDSQVLEDNKIVAVFGICSNTLCVQEHALKRFVSRGGIEKSGLPVLEKLYFSLSVSLVVQRSNSAKYDAKHRSKAVFRFQDNWIFVLTWIENAGIWLLKTAYKISSNERHPYRIIDTHAAVRASAWSPSMAA